MSTRAATRSTSGGASDCAASTASQRRGNAARTRSSHHAGTLKRNAGSASRWRANASRRRKKLRSTALTNPAAGAMGGSRRAAATAWSTIV